MSNIFFPRETLARIKNERGRSEALSGIYANETRSNLKNELIMGGILFVAVLKE